MLEQVELLGHDDIFLVLLQLLPCQVQIHRRHDLVPIVVREQLSLSLGRLLMSEHFVQPADPGEAGMMLAAPPSSPNHHRHSGRSRLGSRRSARPPASQVEAGLVKELEQRLDQVLLHVESIMGHFGWQK